MADDLLNGRAMHRLGGSPQSPTAGSASSARDREQLAGLLAEYPREASPVPRPVTDVLGPLP